MQQIIDPPKLAEFCPAAAHFGEGLERGCQGAGIDTPKRLAMFLAECAHECVAFTRTVENLNYSGIALWGLFKSHFASEAEAESFAHQPERIANRIYAGRIGNGDEASGDGWRYRGRGCIQVTGRDNYLKYYSETGENVLATPDALSLPWGAARSAAIFWGTHNLNRFADAGDLAGCTNVINGGLIGINERRDWYLKACQIWEV